MYSYEITSEFDASLLIVILLHSRHFDYQYKSFIHSYKISFLWVYPAWNDYNWKGDGAITPLLEGSEFCERTTTSISYTIIMMIVGVVNGQKFAAMQ